MVNACTGNAAIKQTFATLASKFSFHIYCPVLPSGWAASSVSWDYKYGFQAHYKTKSGQKIDVWEGNVCQLSPSPCTSWYPDDFGAQAWGPLTGDMEGEASTKAWTNIVHAKAALLYVISGNGMTESAFRSISAALHDIG